MEIDSPGGSAQKHNRHARDDRALAPPFALHLLLLALALHAPRLLAGLAGLIFQGALALEDDGFDGGLVVAGKYLALVAQTARALTGSRGVGPAAYADPYSPLIAGVAPRVRADDVAQRIQLPARGQGIIPVINQLLAAPPPDRAVDKPDLFDHKVHPGGLQPPLDEHIQLEGRAFGAAQIVHALHLAAQPFPILAVANKGRLHADNRLIGQIEHMQADRGLVRCRQAEMPQLNRAA